LGLADLGEQRNMPIYQIAIYVALFLISGYMSFRSMVAPEIEKLQSARSEHGRQKALLQELEENTRQLNIIANNAQVLDAELVSIRRRVFSNENDVLTFMRSLPDTTDRTGNSLMSIVPMKTKVLEAAGQPKTAGQSNDKTNNEPVAQPTTLPCKLKPIEVSFDGGYSNLVNFLKELEKTGQYMTASSITITGAKDSASKVSVKAVLNLVQMDIEPRKPPIDVALLQQKNAIHIPSTTGQTKAGAGTMQRPVTAVVTQKPTNVAKQVASASKPVKNTPVAVSTPAKPVTAKPSTTKSAIKPAKNISVTSSKTEKTAQKTAVAGAAKPSTSTTKQVAKSSADVSAKKTNGAKSANYSVRVGIFDYNENAQKLLNILKSHGYSAWMKTYSYKGKRTHWVYVGTFETKDKAEAFATSMQKELSYIDDYVIE